MSQLSTKMRVYHRYLGFFLAGIMAIYSISGIILIFRETPLLKKSVHKVVKLKPNLPLDDLGKELKIKGFKVENISPILIKFKEGTYEPATGKADYKTNEYGFLVKKMTNLHKASSKHPLFFLNIFFGLSLLFFVLSSFWMFLPQTKIFKKAVLFTLAGAVLTIVLLLL